MATTAFPCVRSVTIPRCTTDSDWRVTDMAVRGNKLAVCGYNYRTDGTPSFIDLFTLNDPDSSSPLMTQLFTKLVNLPRWRYRYVSFLDDSRIVTVCCDIVQVYHIEADDSEPLHTVNLSHDTPAQCITVREEEIFIGLSLSNEVIVFDFRLNKIKTITLKGLKRHDYPEDITFYGDNLFVSTGHMLRNRAISIRYNMEGKIVHEYKSPDYSYALSITVSGLVYILWDYLHVVVYSLSDSQQLMSFNVDGSHRIRIVDVNRLFTVNYLTGEVREYSVNTMLLTYPRLICALTVLLSKNDCHQLAHHLALPKYQLDAIINSDSSTKDLLDILGETGVIHPSNVSRLLEAVSVLKINETALLMLEYYQRSRGDETSYGRFLVDLSSHLLLSLPRKLCDYFEFTNEKKKAVITSQTPGISFLLTLEDMGVINPLDVGKLVTPLKQYQLVQAVAKVQEYQTLVDERSELKKPIHTLEGKQALFIECLRKKTKSWYETLTPLPWKKSCKWMTSELFIACGLVLTDSKSKMKTTDVDQECKLKYTDILTHRRLKSATRIIIEGDPGSGKTMLSSQLAYDWSIGKSSDARMVVFLPLKFVDGMTIIEAIKQFYIPKGKPLNEGDIKAILDQASDENKTCIVLDGLEEYNGRTKDGEPSEVERVMRKEKFPNCTVVLTSRSDFVHDLPRCPMLKLGRFGEEERDQYIANIIPDDREKQQKVKCSIETSALLFDLCSNPLLFVYIVHNIEHLGQIDKPKGQPDSVGPFMEVMVNNLLSLSRSEHSESPESEIMSKRLSEIAFNGLCKGYQQLMWQKSFLNENVSNVKDWIESGILVVEEGVMAREEEHRNEEEAVEEGMVTQDEIISIEDERREGESSSEAAMIRKGQDDILSIDEECPRDRESSTDNMLNEKEKPFTEMKTSTDPQNLSVQVKSLHKVIQERFADDERREGESSSEAAMIGEGQDDILSIDEEKPSDIRSSTDIKPKKLEKPFTKRKTSTDLQNLSLQVKFLHKVIQEWFAAKHFLSMLQRSKGKNRHRLFLNKHLPLINPADLHYVLRFTSYLCPENCYLIMEHLHSCYKSSKGVVPQYILNCIFLCFIECNSLVRNKRMDNPVRQVCKNIVTIRGEDSRLLQQSKVSMLMYASNSKIRIGTLRLVDLVVEVTKATLTFNSNITLECFPTLKVIEVSRWDMRLKEEDFEELIKFITQCKLLNKAFLNFPSPPPSLTDKTLLSSMKKNLTIEWIIGDRIVHTLDKKSGEWPMQFRSTPHQITDFSQPGPSKSSAHSGKTKKAKERTLTPKSVQKQDTEEPGSITTKKKHINTGSQKIVQTPQITKASQILTQGETAYQVMSKSLRAMLMINKEGGRLDIPDTGASLEIPSGALEGEQFIQMIIIPPHLEGESLTFASNSSLVVELLPCNLNLMKPAILTLPHCLVLKKGCEWKAKIYRSHHKEGSKPQWEEQSSTPYHLGEQNCAIEIQRFSWEKFEVDAQIVEAKNIIMYAARRCGPTDTIYLDIGYYLNLATFEEVSKRNNASLLHEKPTVFKKDGNSLNILLEKFEPKNWTYSKGKNPQAISFEDVAISPWHFCTFVLDKTEPMGTDACTCYCKAGQAPNLRNFIFQLKAPDPSSVKQPSTSKRQVHERVGTFTAGIEAPDLVVTTATIQDLSHKFCDEWRIVGSKFGIGEPKLQTIDTDNRTAQEKVYQMLLTWKQSKGNEATYRLLGEALQSAGRKDLQEYLYQQDIDLDTSLSIQSLVNKEGGILEIPGTGVRLEIPSGAIEQECLIQMRIIPISFQEESESSFTSNSTVVVELLPDNLKLHQLAKLTLPHCLQLKKTGERKAMVYSSHHAKGSKPMWRPKPHVFYQLNDTNCVIWIESFSWETCEIDGKDVVFKNIQVYAAGNLDPLSKLIPIRVGFYPKLPGERPRNLQILEEIPFLFRKEGNLPLKITFKEVQPMSWKYTGEEKVKTIPYINVAAPVDCQRSFFFKKVGEEACFLVFEVAQEDPVELIVDFKDASAPSLSGIPVPSQSADVPHSKKRRFNESESTAAVTDASASSLSGIPVPSQSADVPHSKKRCFNESTAAVTSADSMPSFSHEVPTVSNVQHQNTMIPEYHSKPSTVPQVGETRSDNQLVAAPTWPTEQIVQSMPIHTLHMEIEATCGLKNVLTTSVSGSSPALQSRDVRLSQQTRVDESSPVEDATLRDLSGKINKKWKNVGRNLGLKEEELCILETDSNNQGHKESVLQMLLTWKHSNGSKATYRVLGEALEAAGRRDLQEMLYKQGK